MTSSRVIRSLCFAKMNKFILSILSFFFILPGYAFSAISSESSFLYNKDELVSLFTVSPDLMLRYSEPEGEGGSFGFDSWSGFDLNAASYKKNNQYSKLFSESGYLLAVATAVIGGLYFVPEDISGWKNGSRNINYGGLTGRYWDNISNGPVMDDDNPFINYIGHPYVGAAYYVRARHEDYSAPAALSYSFFMSTFVYEYGVEAFFEKPSYQDIIITPIFGAILGEISLSLDKQIKLNGGKLFDSILLGGVASFLIDPLEYIIKPSKSYLHDRFDLRVENSVFYSSLRNDDPFFVENDRMQSERVFGVRIKITRNYH